MRNIFILLCSAMLILVTSTDTSFCDTNQSPIFVEQDSVFNYAPYINISDEYMYIKLDEAVLSDYSDALEIAQIYLKKLKKQNHITDDYFIQKVLYDSSRHIWFFQLQSLFYDSNAHELGEGGIHGPNFLMAVSEIDGKFIGIYFN